jgi:4-diphosphocytidyl-2-C-methyl-D-erythritol kinase
MYSLSLSDEVTVTLGAIGKGVIRVVLDGNQRLPTDKRNLVYIAAERFLQRLGLKAEVTVRLCKHIPVAAGLGGGSSDAAATLRALNRLFSRPFTEKALLSIAAEIGSDVPYCLIGGAALCEGRGDRITRISTERSLHAVIAVADEHVSTPAAYAALDRAYQNFDGTVPHFAEREYTLLMDYLRGGDMPDKLYNIFESVVLESCPGAAQIKEALLSLGARISLMSGSGPSVFGIFDTEEKARLAARSLSESGLRAYYAHGII